MDNQEEVPSFEKLCLRCEALKNKKSPESDSIIFLEKDRQILALSMRINELNLQVEELYRQLDAENDISRDFLHRDTVPDPEMIAAMADSCE